MEIVSVALLLIQIVLGLCPDDKMQRFKCVNHREIKTEIDLLLFPPAENRHHLFRYWCFEANEFLHLHRCLLFAHVLSAQ